MIKRQPPVPPRPVDRSQHQINKGKLIYPEQLAFDPQRFQPAKDLSHRGGLGTARTEHY